jgi:chloramphenicol 3-O-phosphotransferase
VARSEKLNPSILTRRHEQTVQNRPGLAVAWALAGLWSNYAVRGAKRLLLEMLVEDRSELGRLAGAIPGAEITLVRLHAPLELIEQRIRRREPDDPEGELCGARWWAARMGQWAANECVVVNNGDRSVREVAAEVLRAAGWLGG